MESSINELHINYRYNVIENKGKGATGFVYLVEKRDTKKQYAGKVFTEQTPFFQNEVAVLDKLSKLKSSYIVNLFEFGEGPVKDDLEPEKIKQYLILDYASKGDFYDYIYYPSRGFEERHAKFIFKKILEGVQVCHISGICHRDLKMENILLDEHFNPKICDFGFATEIKGEDGSGLLKDYLGTEHYAAPQMYYHVPYDGVKADIFSLGVILLFLVTGRIGFNDPLSDDPYYKYIIL